MSKGVAGIMTLADFYREEADRCQRRAAVGRIPARARRWHELADEYLRLALMMEDAAPARRGALRIPMQQQAVQQQAQVIARRAS
jgi:hypothetical protein